MQLRVAAPFHQRFLICFQLVVCCSVLLSSRSATADSPADIRVQGPGTPPQLGFACCDQGIAAMQALFADPDVIPALRDLHAQVAVAVVDFSPQRAQIVRLLNEQKVPAVAWIMLPASEGVYLNADNAPQAAARVAAFEKWTHENGLRWSAVGLDIEPNFAQLAALNGHRWRLFTTLLRQSFDGGRIRRAQQAYSALIRQIQSQGYSVQTYLMPYVPAERSVHSTLLDRQLGTVDVRGNEEYLMLYTSYARNVGAAMIWSLGPHAQSIAIGSTDGPMPAGSGIGPLNWDEFSRDLLVASHFSHDIGVYNLEGCVRQGFLPRIETMNWNGSVLIPAASVTRAQRMGKALRTALWIGSRSLYFLAAALLMLVWLILRWRERRRNRALTR